MSRLRPNRLQIIQEEPQIIKLPSKHTLLLYLNFKISPFSSPGERSGTIVSLPSYTRWTSTVLARGSPVRSIWYRDDFGRRLFGVCLQFVCDLGFIYRRCVQTNQPGYTGYHAEPVYITRR